MDRLPDAVVTAAAAGIRHRRIDIGIGRVSAPLQQRERAHDHSGLAIAALRCIEFFPCNLDRMIAIGRNAFDRGDSLSNSRARGDAAGADRLPVDMERARAALPDAAAELRAGQAKVIANDPEQWRRWIGIDGMSPTIHVQIERHLYPPMDWMEEL